MYAIYNSYGDLVSLSESPDAVMQSVALGGINTLQEAIDAGYAVGKPALQELSNVQLSKFQRGFIINKPITDLRKRKVTRKEV